jgi:ATP-binding cassette subfamily B protein
VQAALIAFTAFQALQGDITIGQFNLYTQSIVQLGGQMPEFMFMVGALHESNLFAAGLFGLLAMKPQVEVPRPDSKIHLSNISSTPRLEFRNVSFAYPGDNRAVLKDISFIIQPGEAVALVGGNGAGKSTLVKLLAGLYEPTEGQILLDETDIRTLDRRDLRAYLSVIFQDYNIYHFSARENVGVGQVSLLDDSERIEVAAQRSGLDRVIARLPDGYNTVLGRFWERGHELSGGQRQLVALTRALLREAPILILDEPSAALDVYTERRFFQRLLQDRSGGPTQTVVFISHRFTTVRRADRILVLENGRLTGQGTHEDLVSQGGRYAEMFNLQATMYDGPRASNQTTDEDGQPPQTTKERS